MRTKKRYCLWIIHLMCVHKSWLLPASFTIILWLTLHCPLLLLVSQLGFIALAIFPFTQPVPNSTESWRKSTWWSKKNGKVADTTFYMGLLQKECGSKIHTKLLCGANDILQQNIAIFNFSIGDVCSLEIFVANQFLHYCHGCGCGKVCYALKKQRGIHPRE